MQRHNARALPVRFSAPILSARLGNLTRSIAISLPIELIVMLVYPFFVAYVVYFLFVEEHDGLTPISILFTVIYCFFMFSAVTYVRNLVLSTRSLTDVGQFDMPVVQLRAYAKRLKRPLPSIAIFVPARNEGYVIENTIRRLAKLDYPKKRYRIVVITDERELDDDVEILTKDAVTRVADIFNPACGKDFVQYIEVPKWYSGVFGSNEETYEKSTKGRALNYALQVVANSSAWRGIDFIGVLDADGRMHMDVLKEVAYRSIETDAKVLQGPVFQISNVFGVSLVGVAAALELAMHHLTELTPRLKQSKFQFLAGTNYFIDKTLLVQSGAWNQYALVEDAELAMRLYIQQRVSASWLSCPEIEQTPASFAVYCKQRARWVQGHFDLLPGILRSELPIEDKADFVSRVLFAQFRWILDCSFPIIALCYVIFGLIPHLDMILSVVMYAFLALSFLIWDIYGLTYRRIISYLPTMSTVPLNQKPSPIKQSLKLFFFTPVMMVVQVVPRVSALYRLTFARSQTTWYKTERTREVVIE